VPTHHVAWHLDVAPDTPVAAAREAYRLLASPETRPTRFEVSFFRDGSELEADGLGRNPRFRCGVRGLESALPDFFK
jgi:hypothetical protein